MKAGETWVEVYHLRVGKRQQHLLAATQRVYLQKKGEEKEKGMNNGNEWAVCVSGGHEVWPFIT